MSKHLLRNFLSVLMVAGVIVALWPLGQSVYANWNQQQLRAQWQQQRTPNAERPTSNVQQMESTPKTPAPIQRSTLDVQRSTFKPVWPFTRLVIPDADVDVIVLDGWDESTLRKAPGHWPTSSAPGQPGNCAIAGHRNVYGSPFYKIDWLQPGAPIELRTPDATYLYRVLEVKIAPETDTSVIQPSLDPKMPPLLTLVTCPIPRGSSRIIVSATLDSTT